MEHPNFVRIVTFPNGTLTVDIPKGLEAAAAPIKPEDWREDLPADWQYEILSWAEYTAIVGTEKYSNYRLHRSTDGTIACDRHWDKTLMKPKTVLQKHKRRLLGQMKDELASSTPDQIKLASLTYSLLKLPDLETKEIYEIALNSLQYADSPKPAIEEQLLAKIEELSSTEK